MNMFLKKRLVFEIIILTIIFLAPAVFAYNQNEVEWDNGVSGTLSAGSTLTSGYYTVKAVSFTAPVTEIDPSNPLQPFVEIELYRNGSLIVNQPMIKGDQYNSSDDEIRLEVIDMPPPNSSDWLVTSYGPWAKLKLQPRGTPELNLHISAKNGVYTYSHEDYFTVNLTLKNTGNAQAKNIDLTIDTGGLSMRRGSNEVHFDQLAKGEEQDTTIELAIPPVSKSNIYIISAKVSGYDIKDIEYTDADSTSFEIAPPFVDYKLEKIITKKEKIYLGDKLVVALSFENTGPYPIKSINISDYAPEKFVLISNISLNWNISTLQPGDRWSTTYVLNSIEPGFFTLPAAHVRFSVNGEDVEDSSYSDFISVYGPKINLTKDVEPKTFRKGSEEVVTIHVKNEGNIPAQVRVEDTLPADANLTEGNTSLPLTFLRDGDETSLEYTFKSNFTEGIQFPPATAYFSFGDRKGKILSDIPSTQPEITPTPVETETQSTVAQPTPVLTVIPTPVQSEIPEDEGNITVAPTSEKSAPGFELPSLIIIIAYIYYRFRTARIPGCNRK